jgi:hypothetical protein
MTITLDLTEEQSLAVTAFVEQVNDGLPPDQPPYTNESYLTYVLGKAVDGYTADYNKSQLQKLVPLGEKYVAAPASIQEEIDALLAPFNP